MTWRGISIRLYAVADAIQYAKLVRAQHPEVGTRKHGPIRRKPSFHESNGTV